MELSTNSPIKLASESQKDSQRDPYSEALKRIEQSPLRSLFKKPE